MKKFPASLEHLHDMLSFIATFASETGFISAISSKIILATEEALVNVIHHGYPNKKGEIEIFCEETIIKPGMRIFIQDKGIRFNPIKQAHKKGKEIKKKEPVKEGSIGGYGIFIYVELMDQVEYYEAIEGNVLLLIKYL